MFFFTGNCSTIWAGHEIRYNEENYLCAREIWTEITRNDTEILFRSSYTVIFNNMILLI